MIDNKLELYNGDSEDVLKNIPDASIDLVVTSPPYDNLRSYMGVGETWNHDKFCAIALPPAPLADIITVILYAAVRRYVNYEGACFI